MFIAYVLIIVAITSFIFGFAYHSYQTISAELAYADLTGIDKPGIISLYKKMVENPKNFTENERRSLIGLDSFKGHL